MTYPVEDVGSIIATWTDPDGVVWELTNSAPDGPGWFTVPGPSGWDATTYEIVTDPVPRGGETVRFVRSKPARIVWPLYVYGDSHISYVQRKRAIKKAFTSTLHKRTPGLLTVTRSDDPGNPRQISCYYESGLEGESGDGWMYSKDAITLFAPDGYWQDTNVSTVTYSYIPGVDYFNPFPQVSDSLNLGTSAINNGGDVDAWPTWTITGPMSAITATNTTTGYEFSLTAPLNAGEQITITTAQPTVRGPAGQNLVGNLNWPEAYLWWLTPGDNMLIINVSGAAAGTTVELSFQARHEGA